MRITVVGAILIVATAVAIVLLVHALNKRRDGGSNPKRAHNGTET